MDPATVAGGITLDTAGGLSGTPTEAGSFPITVTATNGVAPDAVKQFTLVIAPANTDTPPDFSGDPTGGTQGQPYSFAFTGITGSPAPTFTMDPATIAGGITLSSAGALSGTPTEAGSFPITVTATNGVAPDAVKQFTIVIAPVSTDTPPDFSGEPPAATQGQAYNFAFTGVTGSPAPTFALDPVSVAGGITLDAAGVLSGTPTEAGSFPITVTATNGVAPDAVKQFTLVVNPDTPVPPVKPKCHYHLFRYKKWDDRKWDDGKHDTRWKHDDHRHSRGRIVSVWKHCKKDGEWYWKRVWRWVPSWWLSDGHGHGHHGWKHR
jgi:hypothetical protein